MGQSKKKSLEVNSKTPLLFMCLSDILLGHKHNLWPCHLTISKQVKESHSCSLRQHTLWSLHIQTASRVYANLLRSSLALLYLRNLSTFSSSSMVSILRHFFRCVRECMLCPLLSAVCTIVYNLAQILCVSVCVCKT